MMVSTPDWVKDAVFYQIFPDRFARSGRVAAPGPFEPWDAAPTRDGFKGGDLFGVAERLPELAELGISALYLNPVFASASNHRYHTYDYLTVDPLLGGNAALRELIDRAHELGMRVILDGVFNHSGRGFWPFHHVVENGAGSPYRDWFLLDPEVRAGRGTLDPYPREEPGPDYGGSSYRGGYRAWWGLPALPKLNVSNPAMREYLLTVGESWLRFGIDGWRLDVPDEIEDETFWAEFRNRCRAVDPDAYLVGEIWEEAPRWLAGDRFDALMNYPLGAAILGFVGGDNLDSTVIADHLLYRDMIRRLDGAGFGQAVDRLMTIYDPAAVAVQLNLIGSHDAPRPLTVLGGDLTALRLAMLLQLTLPGAPCIYYGDEIAMVGGDDPDCRGAYPVSPSAGDQALRAFVIALTAARRDHVALRRGAVRCLATTGDAVALLRTAEGRSAVVAVNAGSRPAVLDVELAPGFQPVERLTVAPERGGGPTIVAGPTGSRLELPGRSAFVLLEH